MSIASEITRLQGVKANILQAIADKGVEVPSGSKLANCPNLIASISGGGGGESSFFKKSFAMPKSLAYNSDSKRLLPVLNDGGALFFLDNFAENGLYKFYLKLVFYKRLQPGQSGLSDKIVGYRGADAFYDKGRFFNVELTSSGNLILKIARSKSEWEVNTIKNDVQSGLHSLVVSLDQKNFTLKFDDESLFSRVVDDYTNGFFSPVIGCDSFILPLMPHSFFFTLEDYIDASETRMNINGNDVLGF